MQSHSARLVDTMQSPCDPQSKAWHGSAGGGGDGRTLPTEAGEACAVPPGSTLLPPELRTRPMMTINRTAIETAPTTLRDTGLPNTEMVLIVPTSSFNDGNSFGDFISSYIDILPQHSAACRPYPLERRCSPPAVSLGAAVMLQMPSAVLAPRCLRLPK